MFTGIHELINERKYDAAREALEPLLADETSKIAAYAEYLLGYINTCRDYPNRKEYLARRYLSENLQGEYPHPYAYVLYSKLIEDRNVALNYLNKGLVRYPTDVRILGELLAVSPDKDLIVATIRDREIDNPWMLGRVISYLISSNQWAAIRLFISRIRKNPDIQTDEQRYLDLIEAYSFIFGDIPEYTVAIELLEKTIKDDTDNELAYSHYLGVIYAAIELNDLEKAKAYFDRLPVNNSIMDFDDGPRPWDINIVFERVYKKVFDRLSEVFAHDNHRKNKAAALYSMYLHYPSDMFDVCRYKKSDAAVLARYLKTEFNKAVAATLYDMRCHFKQANEAYDVLWSFLCEFEDPETNSVFFSDVLNCTDNDSLRKIVELTITHIKEDDFDTDCFVRCVFSELVAHLHEKGWYDSVREIVVFLSNTTIAESGRLFECAYALGECNDERATVLYEELIKKEPENSSAINNLGVQYRNGGDLFKALECYERACSLSPKEELYQNNLQSIRKSILQEREKDILDISESISIAGLENMGYTTDLCRRILMIKDADMRNIIQRDIQECAVAILAKQDKLATIMCGSIVEALLMQRIFEKGISKCDITAISKHKNASNYSVSDMGLNELLYVADKERLLNKNNYHLGHYIRDYRNVVHPAKEIRTKETVSHENVLTMWSVLCRLIWDLFP